MVDNVIDEIELANVYDEMPARFDVYSRPVVTEERGLHRDGEKARIADTGMLEVVMEAGRIFAQNNQPRPGYPDGKYPDIDGKMNYMAGIQVTKLVDSMTRHVIAIAQGEDIDPDSGFRHAGHILCNLTMLEWMIHHRPDMDNRG